MKTCEGIFFQGKFDQINDHENCSQKPAQLEWIIILPRQKIAFQYDSEILGLKWVPNVNRYENL